MIWKFIINEGRHARYSRQPFSATASFAWRKSSPPAINPASRSDACAVNAQIGIADWLAKGPYHDWKLQRYKCVLGKYVPKNEV